MKRVVFSLGFFLLLTLSSAFHLLFDHDHHDDHIKPSALGDDSSMILLPTESSPLPDHTKVSPFVEKEERQEDDFTQSELVKPGVLTPLDRNRFPLRGLRFKHLRCQGRKHRFTHIPHRVVGVNELGAAPIHKMDLNMVSNNDGVHGEVVWHRHRPRHHHRHHHRKHDFEEQEEENEHEHENRKKHLMKRLRKFLGYF